MCECVLNVQCMVQYLNGNGKMGQVFAFTHGYPETGREALPNVEYLAVKVNPLLQIEENCDEDAWNVDACTGRNSCANQGNPSGVPVLHSLGIYGFIIDI